MNQTEMAQRVTEKFQTADGMVIDVLYGTSDGQLFFTPEEAADAAKTMADTVITPYYKDIGVREMASKYTELQKMVFATDYLKRAKVKRQIPVYTEFVTYARTVGTEPINHDIFHFVMGKVFGRDRMVGVGQRDKIFTYAKGIVEAFFLRRYPEGMVWQVGDSIVFTCPTNTELMRGEYKTMFSPILDPVGFKEGMVHKKVG